MHVSFASTCTFTDRAISDTGSILPGSVCLSACLPVCLLCCSLHHHQSRPERLTSASSPPQLWGWPFPNLTPVWLAGRGKARIRGATLGEDLPWGSGPQKPQRIPTWHIRVRSYYLREGGRFHTDFNTLKSFNFLIMSLVVWYVPKSDDWTWTGIKGAECCHSTPLPNRGASLKDKLQGPLLCCGIDSLISQWENWVPGGIRLTHRARPVPEPGVQLHIMFRTIRSIFSCGLHSRWVEMSLSLMCHCWRSGLWKWLSVTGPLRIWLKHHSQGVI